MAAIDVSHPSDHEGCDRRSAAHRSHRPDQWEGPPACSAATCVDVCVACSRTLGRVHVVHFVSDVLVILCSERAVCVVLPCGVLRKLLSCAELTVCADSRRRGLSEGNEHVWLFTRRVLLPLVSASALESTPFVMAHAACCLQGV